MRPISFENLRRLVGRKKDRNEPSFKRSESFKRISIRKSYLDRGKRRNKIQKNAETTGNEHQEHLPEQELRKEPLQKISGSATTIIIQDDAEPKIQKAAGTIGYGEWIHDVNSPLEKNRDDFETRPAVQRVRNTKVSHQTVTQINKIDTVTSELAVLKLDSSPIFPRCVKSPVIPTVTERPETVDDTLIQDVTNPVEGPPSVSVSLGRVWRDAVPVPFPTQVKSIASAHHSLDSGLKERKPQPTVARTVSAPEKSLSTSKDSSGSSFSFSLSISRLADLRSNRNGFFRRKGPKPSPSVSADGYFKRTSVPRRSSGRRRAIRSSMKKTNVNSTKKILPKDIKQVTRPASPVWFVPPERRRSKRLTRVWREIRYLTVEEDHPMVENKSDEWSSNVSDEFDDQQLLLSGDFNERRDVFRQRPVPAPPSSSLGTATSSSACSRISTSSSKSSEGSGCPAPKISDFNEDKLFSEELRVSGILAQRPTWRPSTTSSMNYFASTQFLSFLTKNSSLSSCDEKKDGLRHYRCFSSSDSESESRNDVSGMDINGKVLGDRVQKQREPAKDNQQSQQQKRAGPKRRPLRRKSQLKRANGGQPVYLVRKCSSVRRRPSKMNSRYSFLNISLRDTLI